MPKDRSKKIKEFKHDSQYRSTLHTPEGDALKFYL